MIRSASRPASRARLRSIRAIASPESGCRLLRLRKKRVNTGPGGCPRTLRQAAAAATGSVSGFVPRATVTSWPCPSWSVLDRRMVTSSPSVLSSTSRRMRATSSERRIAEAWPRAMTAASRVWTESVAVNLVEDVPDVGGGQWPGDTAGRGAVAAAQPEPDLADGLRCHRVRYDVHPVNVPDRGAGRIEAGHGLKGPVQRGDDPVERNDESATAEHECPVTGARVVHAVEGPYAGVKVAANTRLRRSGRQPNSRGACLSATSLGRQAVGVTLPRPSHRRVLCRYRSDASPRVRARCSSSTGTQAA